MDYEGSRKEFLEILAQHDVPAFVRRAQSVGEAWTGFQQRCQADCDRMLEFARSRLGVVAARVDQDWQRLTPFLKDADDIDYLASRHAQWQPVLLVPVEPTDANRKLRAALREMNRAWQRFNARWNAYLKDVDLSEVNGVREGYNKYYVIEKSCAFGSEVLGREGFEPMEMLTVADVRAEFPLLRIPELHA